MNFKEVVKSSLQSGLHRIGYHIHKIEGGVRQSDPYQEQMRLVGRDIEVLFEVGAADGRDVLMYHSNFPKAAIHCFEPLPESFSKIIEKTSNLERIHANNVALSDKVGTAKFHTTALLDASSLFPSKSTDSSFDRYMQPRDVVSVNTDTIDNYCSKNKIDKIDVLKMDAQGAELLVLNGASELLDRRAIKLVYTEINFKDHFDGGVRFDKLMSFMYDHGFQLHGLYGLVHNQRGELAWGDAIFLRA